MAVSQKKIDSVQNAERATALLDSLPDATALVGDSGMIRAVNTMWRMFSLDNGGRPAATGVGVNYLDVCTRSAADGCQEAAAVAVGLRNVLAGETVHDEIEYPCPSPTADRWFLLRINPLGGPDYGAVLSHMNITRRKAAERELAHEAAHDPLTGLANRTLFTARLRGALTLPAARASHRDVGVLYLDLDGFKPVNDTYGHDAGDEVLQTVAYRLREQIRPQDTVARLGGDEFAVVAPRITAMGLAGLAHRIDKALAEVHHTKGASIHVPASVGSYLAAPSDHVDDAVRHADQAMYAVKQSRASREE
jgi:diguanylate cyclase (GGDEF)-like protein